MKFIVNNIFSLSTCATGIIALAFQRIGLIPADNVSSIILILLIFLATTNIFEVKVEHLKIEKSLNNIHKDILNKLEDGISVKILESLDDYYIYLTKRFKEANEWYDMGGFDPNFSDFPMTPSRQKYYANINKFVKSGKLNKNNMRYIAHFNDNDSEHFNRICHLINNGLKANYNVSAFDSLEIPMIEFTLVDQQEVIMGYYDKVYAASNQQRYFAITHPQLVKMFLEYYEVLWKDCSKEQGYLKKGKTINTSRINAIKSKYSFKSNKL